MMIIEMPGRPHYAARPVRRRRFPRDIAVFAGEGRRSSVATQSGFGGARPDAAKIDKAKFEDARFCKVKLVRPRGGTARVANAAALANAPLPSLADAPLARRFHAWNGRSGSRYICSVFLVADAEPQAGLPDFAEAVFVAVGIAADGLRYPIAFFECGNEATDTTEKRQTFLYEALSGSVREWHVHLLARDADQRQAMLADLDATRNNGIMHSAA